MITRLARLLADHPQDIVARFEAKVRAGSAGDGSNAGGGSGARESRRTRESGTMRLDPPRSMLLDRVPSFLASVTERLEHDPRTSRLGRARAHGLPPWQPGDDVRALVREYGLLRQAILEVAQAGAVAVSPRELELLAECLDSGVGEAVEAYVVDREREREEQQAKLDFSTQAGELLASSLDYPSTLNRLTALLVPRLADWCVVHLDGVDVAEMPIAHVEPSKVEIVRDIYQRFPLPAGSPHGARRVIESGEPQLVRDIDPTLFARAAQSPEHRALLEELGARSWLIVPLAVQGHMFGALTLVYSVSGRRYDDAALALACDLARRAAIAIDNARLYRLSQQERSRVEAATRAKDEFVAMVSHELRTPLNAILGWVRLMRSGSLSEQKREHAFEVIERNANAQSQLVADLLDISRALTGRIHVHPAQVDLANIVDMALEDVRLALEAKRIEVQVELEREHAIMRGDGERLQQVVWNLLSNAAKFTPKGGQVRVGLRRVESDLELSVTDNGVGISPAFLPHVFESFRQWDAGSARTHGGLGVGLSIAKHLVDLHGGSIQAESEGLGRGARFVVRLPISPLLSTTLGVPQVPATREPAAPMPTAAGAGLRVLVVEDEPDARELIGYVLESCGMEVRLSPSVAAALSELSAFTPDVIVSDIGMPDEDGYSLIKNLRTSSKQQHKDIPAIALTAFARNDDRTRALVAGFNLHMSKPVEPSALVRAVLDLAGPLSRN